MVKKSEGGATNSVTLDEEGIINVVFRGRQTASGIGQTYREVERLASVLKSGGKKVRLLVDIKKLRIGDISSQTREASKVFLRLSNDGTVIVGKGIVLTTSLYIIKLVKPRLNIAYFSTYRQARKWLKRSADPSPRRPTLSLITGIIIGIIGCVSLIGWQFHQPLLTAWIPMLPPMNPLTALGLIDICYGFISYWAGKVQNLRIMGWVGIGLGILAILPFDIDHLLYGHAVMQTGQYGTVTEASALCIILMGIVGLIAGRPQRWVFTFEYIAVIIMTGLGLINIFGLLYAPGFMLSTTTYVVMPFSVAVAFTAIGISLFLLIIYRQGKSGLGRVSTLGWLVVAVLVIAQIATYGGWVQTRQRNESESLQAFEGRTHAIYDSLNDRIQSYTQVLRGYRGLFTASEEVTQRDFTDYYSELQLKNNYPGLRSIAYIAAVPDSQLSRFVRERQLDMSLNRTGNPNFKIKDKTDQPTHYIVTYSADEPQSTALGLDLTSLPNRTSIYSHALASGQSYASGTVMFVGTAQQPAAKGFFITIPVRTNTSTAYTGLVNANFNYQDFFAAVFDDQNLDNDLRITIKENGNVFYSSDHMKGAIRYTKGTKVSVENASWDVVINAPDNFGVREDQTFNPYAILIAGQLFSVLLIFIFLLQNRGRRQAIDLADEATTDLRSERNHISELHSKDEAILGGIGEGLVTLNKEGKVERINKAAEKLLDVRESDMIGQLFYEAVPATDMLGEALPQIKRPALRAFKEKKAITEKLYYVRKDGSRFPAELNVAPVVMDGKVIGAIEIFRDITHDYELDKAKSEFVSLASHQLRTPLSAVNWYSEMLISGDAGKLTKDQAEYLKEIYEGNQRMIELVNSLLDVSRLELGRMANNPAPTDMIGLIIDLEKELVTLVETKQVTVDNHLPSKLEPVVADPKLLRMIVQNLLSNAVKYNSQKGTMTVVLRRIADAEAHKRELSQHGPYIYFSVADTGYGIPQEQQKHIFEKLFRADNVRKLDVEGTGLGLYIVKQVAVGMGGTVWFDSKEGDGTTFHVILPIKAAVPKSLEQQNE